MYGVTHVLAIDLGTTGLKVAIVRDDGAVVALAGRPIAMQYVVGGGVEQDAHEWWRLIADASREALSTSGTNPAAIDAIVCTSQYMSVVPVAANGVPVGPAIMWMDRRGAEHTRTLRRGDNLSVWLDHHGLAPFGADDLTHIALMRHESPDVYARAAAFVEPVDAITARLSGEVTANQNTAFPLLLIDNRSHGVTTYDTDLVTRADIDPATLPRLVEMGSVVGHLSHAVAHELGLRAGTAVLSGTIDSTTSAVGTGALSPDRCGVVIGTTSVAVSHVPTKRADHARALMTAPSPIGTQHVVLAENGAGGKVLDHIAGLLGSTAAALIAAAAEAPPGCDGTMMLPWLVGAMAPSPDSSARAGFVGLSLGTTQAHLARAVLEGVAINMATLLPAVEKFVGSTYTDVSFGGGAAASALWGQILADACGRTVHRVAEPRATNARGAALLAMHQLGILAIDDLPRLIPVAQTHEPSAGSEAVFAEAAGRMVAAQDLLRGALTREEGAVA